MVPSFVLPMAQKPLRIRSSAGAARGEPKDFRESERGSHFFRLRFTHR
jgi:hypothetical protein